MRRSYSGNARATTLAGAVSSAAVSLTVADATGYPTGAAGPFVVTLNGGNAAEEKVLVASRTGNTLSVTSRGWDGTTASDHDNAASVQHTISATDLDEANALANGGGTIQTTSPSVVALTVKGAVGQTTQPMLEGRNSSGTSVFQLAPSGFVYSAGQSLTGAASSGVVLTVRGSVGQTAPLAEFANSAGTVLTSVTAAGTVVAPLANFGSSTDVIVGGTATGATNDTSLQLRYSNGTIFQTSRVTLGAADSGGAGFRLLRVAN